MVNAIVTLLFTQDYLPGALVLGKSLKQIGLPQDVKLVVLLATALTDYELNLLRSVFDEILETELIYSNSTNELALLKRPELKPAYSKINLFKLTQFSQILYLDSDTLPLKDLTHLFNQYSHLSTDQILASPDSGWPDIFNSGLFLIKPSLETYDSLVTHITQSSSPSFDGADQGLLNQFFSGNKWVKLPFLYNVTPSGQYQYQPAFQYFRDDIKLLHYIGKQKPWNTADKSGEKQQWWDKYYEFFGWGAIKEVIHGIKPKFYVPVKPEKADIDHTIVYQNVGEKESVGKVKENVDEAKKSLDDANYILSNPQTFESFYTVTADEQWDPSREEPPVDGRPEALNFPDLEEYVNEWDKPYEHHHHEEHHVEHHEEYHHQDLHDEPLPFDEHPSPESEPEWKPPPLFPWEFKQQFSTDSYTPERSFTNQFEYSFDNPWEDLPIFTKIKNLKIKQAQDRALELAREAELEEEGGEKKEEREVREDERRKGEVELIIKGIEEPKRNKKKEEPVKDYGQRKEVDVEEEVKVPNDDEILIEPRVPPTSKDTTLPEEEEESVKEIIEHEEKEEELEEEEEQIV